MPTFDSGGKPVDVENTFTELSGLSAGAFNAYLINAQDIGSSRWLSLHLTGTWTGTLAFYVSNTSTFSPTPLAVTNVSTGATLTSVAGSGSSGNGIYVAPINFRYLWVQMIAWTSGTALGVLELYDQPAPGNPTTFLGFSSGSGSVIAAAADQSGTEQRVSLYGTWSGAGDTALQLGPSGAVIVNESRLLLAIAASVSTDTTLKASPGYLTQILVTTVGTNAMQIFNNASVGSGTIIGIVPASSAVGTIVQCRAPASAGITVKGNAANPAVTVFYT